jgi:hypothetical protein
MASASKSLPIIGGLFIGLAIVGAIDLARINRDDHAAKVAPEGGVELPGGAPFVGASKYQSIEQAQAATTSTLRLPRPSDSLASDDQVSDVWVADGADTVQVRIDYASGVYVEITAASPQLASSQAEAEVAYKRMAEEDASSTNGEATLTHVLSVPAYLIPTDSAIFANGESQRAPGSIEFILGDQTIDIVGHVSDDELMRMAVSVLQSNGAE